MKILPTALILLTLLIFKIRHLRLGLDFYLREDPHYICLHLIQHGGEHLL